MCLAAQSALAGGARCWYENGAVVVAAAYGDIAGDFIVDLSAPRSQLHATRALADGIATAQTRADLVIGGDTLRSFPVDIVDLDARSLGFATNIAGLIGADILRRRGVDLSFSPCRFELRARPGARPHGAVERRLVWVAGVPTVQGSISDGAVSRLGLFAIDTASLPSRIVSASLSRRGVRLDSAFRPAAPARLRALSLAGRLFEQTPARPADSLPDGLAGSIGDAVWSRFHLSLDADRAWLEEEP
jgi:hypothetical protein